MKIKLTPGTRSQIKEMAEFYNETPEGLVARFIEQITPARFEGYKIAREEEMWALTASIKARMPENKIDIPAIKEAVLNELGDDGTCVSGMKLRFEGRFIADQICQGSVTNEVYFQRVKEAMVAEGADPSKFEIEYGWMD